MTALTSGRAERTARCPPWFVVSQGPWAEGRP